MVVVIRRPRCCLTNLLVGIPCRLMFLGATTYDVHRSIKNNDRPPTREQVEALQAYIESKKN